MDDQFLYEARPALDDVFANALYRRISRSYGFLPLRFLQRSWSPLVKLAALAGFMAVVLIYSSTDVRAQVRAIVEGIGRKLDPPASWLIGNMIVIDTPPSEMRFEPEMVVDPEATSLFAPVEVPLSELDRIFGVHIDLPAWAPEECELEPLAMTFEGDAQPSAMLRWVCGAPADRWEILLFVERGGMIAHFPPGSYEQLDLDGGKALIVHGIWSQEGDAVQWDTGNKALYWDRNNHLYEIVVPSERVTDEDLLRVAESAY